MADTSTDLWPEDIAVDVRTPTMILREQAEALTRKTKGILRGQVEPSSLGTIAQLSLDLFAPVLGFRQELLRLRYANELPYPAIILSSHFLDTSLRPAGRFLRSQDDPDPSYWKLTSGEEDRARIAHTPEEINNYLKAVFNAPSTKATLLSLIARSNEFAAINPTQKRTLSTTDQT